jgi:hypothetical protein
MKGLFLLSVAFLAVVIFSCGSQSPVSINNGNSSVVQAATLVCDYWNNLTQTAKDNAMITRANADNGTYVGLNCKQWVSKVVLDASKNCVVVPTTASAQYYWNADCSGHIIGRSTLIANVNRGDIIQMYLYICDKWDVKNNCIEMIYTPHTAIVLSKTATSMTCINSNWGTANYLKVTTVTVNFSDFYRWVSGAGCGHTLYHVQ